MQRVTAVIFAMALVAWSTTDAHDKHDLTMPCTYPDINLAFPSVRSNKSNFYGRIINRKPKGDIENKRRASKTVEYKQDTKNCQ